VNALLNRKNPENHLKPFAAASSGRGEVSSRQRKGEGPDQDDQPEPETHANQSGCNAELRRDPQPDAKPDPKPDPRHALCRELILAMQERLGVSYPWTAAFAGQLGSLLRSRPDLSVEDFARWLRNLAASDDEYAHKRTSKWLPNLQEYSRGPLDRHRRLKQDLPGANAPRRKTALEKYLEVA